MLNTFFNIFFLIAGLFLLIKGSDIFVDAASAIGKLFKMSKILIGLTIVAFGTSLPELLVGITAAAKGNDGIVIGNILGSNIFNTCIILGIICLINPIKFLRETVKTDIYMNLLTGIILLTLLSDKWGGNLSHNLLSRTDGIILLIFFSFFIYYTLYAYEKYIENKKKENEEEIAKNAKNTKSAKDKKEEAQPKEEKVFHLRLKDIDIITKKIGLIILGIIMIYFGSEFVVYSTEYIALALHFSETFIAVMVISIGTSLPELTTTIVSLRKGRSNIAIGNLIGSNMFNILLVLGASSVVSPVILPTDTLIIDCLVFIFASLVIAISSRTNYEISKKEGVILITTYVGYLAFVIGRL